MSDNNDVWEFVAEQAWLARASIDCHRCSARTSVYGLYVRDALEQELPDRDAARRVDGFLHYVSELDAKTEQMLLANTRLSPDESKSARQVYWMNHCERCDARIGDHYIFSIPDEAFFPTGAAGQRAIHYDRLGHMLRAVGNVGEVSFGPAEPDA